ncbi:MAG: alpha/beta hydrolase [Citrobacter freundii]|nr:MAG: alpha/beta hydrolase [Citrobacter freundii]
MQFTADILGNGFEQLTISQPDDYEGAVVCTLIRKTCAAPSCKGVLYVHGYNDYFFQEEMAAAYLNRGYNFYALDLRKYGRSYRPHQLFNHTLDLSEYYADITDAIAIMRQEGNTTIILSGHSNGGLTMALFAHDHKGKGLFDGLFLNSPFFDMPMNAFVKKLLVPMIVRRGAREPAKLLKMGFNEVYGHSLHKEKRGEWSYNTNWKPHISPGLSYGWFRAVRIGQARVAKGLVIDKPVLIMHAANTVLPKKWTDKAFTADVILDQRQIRRGAAKIKGDVTVIAVQDGVHDLILSRADVRERVYQQLFSWLDSYHY